VAFRVLTSGMRPVLLSGFNGLLLLVALHGVTYSRNQASARWSVDDFVPVPPIPYRGPALKDPSIRSRAAVVDCFAVCW
jgi:hypothetical protein